VKEVKIKTLGMSCTGCEGLVKEMVSELDGVKSVKPSFKKELVEVKFDESKVKVEDIKKKINEAGYKAE
jgi:copper ion binding protein